jgi:CMP-N-acetylneuraminic acid synthetase
MKSDFEEKNILAVIPARGKSKRIPRKNLTLLGEKPLICYTIEAALGAGLVKNVVVTTDDLEIAETSKLYGAQVQYPRPEELSGDTSSSLDVLKHSVAFFEAGGSHPDIIVLLQPTSPFRTARHIDEAIKLLLETNADTVTAVRKVIEHPYYLWKTKGETIVPLYTYDHQTMGRNKLPSFYIENGSIYVTTRGSLFRFGLYGKTVVPYEMTMLESVDIDEPIDLTWAEFLISHQFVYV